jgi:multiple sugar transport system permease protein
MPTFVYDDPPVRSSRPIAAGLLWSSPWIVGLCAFLLIPLVLSFWYSLTDYPLLKPAVFIGLDNYTSLLQDERFWRVVRNTTIYSLFAIPLCTVVSLVLAAMLASPGVKWPRLWTALIFMPTLVPMMAAAMIWLWLLNARYGAINVIFGTLGVVGPNWLEDASWALPSILLTSVWGIGQMMVVYIAAINEVPRSLYEAARIDGMSAPRRLWHVTLPMISPTILFNVITLTIGSFQTFVMPYVLFRNERGQKAAGDFYNLYLYDNAFVYQKFGAACAMAWMQLLVVLALTGLMLLASKKLVHYRGA